MKKIKLFIAICCFFSATANGQVNDYRSYKLININDLLKSNVVLPKAGYYITNVKFIANYTGQAGQIGEVSKDQFRQLQEKFPRLKFKFGHAAAQFKTRDSVLWLPLSESAALWKKIANPRFTSGSKVIYAQIVVSKYERYGIARELIIKGIEPYTEENTK